MIEQILLNYLFFYLMNKHQVYKRNLLKFSEERVKIVKLDKLIFKEYFTKFSIFSNPLEYPFILFNLFFFAHLLLPSRIIAMCSNLFLFKLTLSKYQFF